MSAVQRKFSAAESRARSHRGARARRVQIDLGRSARVEGVVRAAGPNPVQIVAALFEAGLLEEDGEREAFDALLGEVLDLREENAKLLVLLNPNPQASGV